jgi:hypothetical protein
MKKLFFLFQVSLFSCFAVAQSATAIAVNLDLDSSSLPEAVNTEVEVVNDFLLELLEDSAIVAALEQAAENVVLDVQEQSVEEVLTVTEEVVEVLEQLDAIVQPVEQTLELVSDLVGDSVLSATIEEAIQEAAMETVEQVMEELVTVASEPVAPVAVPQVALTVEETTLTDSTLTVVPAVQPVAPVAVPTTDTVVLVTETVELAEVAELTTTTDTVYVQQVVTLDTLTQPVKAEITKLVTELVAQPTKQLKYVDCATALEAESGAVSKKIALTDPTTEKIKADLVGCTVSDHKDGYGGEDWNVTISENNIVKVQIVAKKSYEQFYYCNVNLVLQQTGGAILVSCELVYEVGVADWELKSVISQQINYVKTGFYDKFVILGTAAYSNDGLAMYQPLINQSASVLAVGGVYFNGVEWKKFYQIIPADCVAYINDVLVQDAQIHFVEFPY